MRAASPSAAPEIAEPAISPELPTAMDERPGNASEVESSGESSGDLPGAPVSVETDVVSQTPLERVERSDSVQPVPTPLATQPAQIEPATATDAAQAAAVEHEPIDLTLPTVGPLPAVPDRGLLRAARYALGVTRARWQRRGAKKLLAEANVRDEVALEATHLQLGTEARALGLSDPVLDQENRAIERAEHRRAEIERACREISSHQAHEDSAFADTEMQHLTKVSELERQRDALQRDIDDLEARRRGAQDKLDTVERQQRGYIKAAEQRDEEAGRAAMGDARSGLRRAAEELRRDAAGLEAEKLDLERRLAELERPTSQALARREDILSRLDSARRELQDVRDGHRHRLAELDAEQNRRTRELSQADAEVNRHLTTLGTLANLHRTDRAELVPLYRRIDELRNAIGIRSTESDRLAADSEAYDRESYRRGYLIVGAALLGVALLILILVLTR